MKKLLMHMFTTVDNETFDLSRVLWALAIIVSIALSIYVVVARNTAWAIVDFGTGIGALLGAGGAAVWAGDASSIKSKTGKIDPVSDKENKG